MFKKILKAIWILFLEVLSIPLDIIMFPCVLAKARDNKKRYDIPVRATLRAYIINIKNQYIARLNWINGDKSIWNS